MAEVLHHSTKTYRGKSLGMFESQFLQDRDICAVHSILPLLLAAVSVLALVKSKKRELPGPRPFPFIGTRWVFWTRYSINKMHLAYEDMRSRYGNIFVEWSGDVPLVSICSRTGVEAVLRHPARVPYRPPTEIVQCYRLSRPDRYASSGLVNEQGERWSFLRRHLTPELTSPSTMARFVPALNDICDDFIALLTRERKEDGLIRNFDLLTNRMGLESSCALVLGARLGFLNDNPNLRAEKLAVAVKAHFKAQRDSYFGVPLWKFIPTPLYRRFKASEDTIHDLVTQIMEDTANEMQSSDDTEIRSLLFSILNNQYLDEKDKKSGIIDFITAGIETLANSVVFLLHLICSRPDWQQKIRLELAEARKGTSYDVNSNEVSKRSITAAQMRLVPSARAAVMEAFRLLPTAPFLARLLDSPITLDGHKLPAGTFIFVHTLLACRSDDNFYRASEYLPERWLETQLSNHTIDNAETQISNHTIDNAETQVSNHTIDNEELSHNIPDMDWNIGDSQNNNVELNKSSDTEKHVYKPHSPQLVAPFGRGKRMCPGKRFIELELQMLLVKLVEKFEIQAAEELELDFDFLLAPRSSVSFRLVEFGEAVA